MRFLVLLLVLLAELSFCLSSNEEIFTEELLLRPLPDAKVLSHFHFVSKLPPIHTYGTHHRLFPKAIFQLVTKFRIREMDLSFTQSRWDYQRWGSLDPVAQLGAKPVGVQLSASLDVPDSELDATWGNLTNALSGLFCASFNFLESPTTYMDPWFAFSPQPNATRAPAEGRLLTVKQSTGNRLRYGALPREAICTENLTPWLKLLPCRDKAGLTQLLDRPTVHSSFYQSLRLAIKSGDSDATTLEQSLTLVSKHGAPDWSLSSIFGVEITSSCPLAKLSKVYLETQVQSSGGSGDTGVPSLLEYQVDGVPSGIGSWSPARAPYSISRFLTGSGNARGSIAILFREHHGSPHCGDSLTTILQMVPWYVRLYGHTLQVSVDGRALQLWDAVTLMRFTPGEDRKSPAALEIALCLPANAQTVALSIEYDKGFLHIEEHPPDARHGFELPSAIISFPECRIQRRYGNATSPLLDALQREYHLKLYSEALLIPLATPDFSMPYNVITFTCTMLAIYYGGLLNALGRRIGQEQGHAKGGVFNPLLKRLGWAPSAGMIKVLKILLVVALGVALNQYLTAS